MDLLECIQVGLVEGEGVVEGRGGKLRCERGRDKDEGWKEEGQKKGGGKEGQEGEGCEVTEGGQG